MENDGLRIERRWHLVTAPLGMQAWLVFDASPEGMDPPAGPFPVFAIAVHLSDVGAAPTIEHIRHEGKKSSVYLNFPVEAEEYGEHFDYTPTFVLLPFGDDDPWWPVSQYAFLSKESAQRTYESRRAELSSGREEKPC